VLAGATLTAEAIAGGWQRVIKICPLLDQAAAATPTVVELPAVRRWNPRELTIVDAAGCGYIVRLSDGDEMYGGGAFVGTPPVVRLTPVLTDCPDEPDAWAAT
jgi:hypothetical protein